MVPSLPTIRRSPVEVSMPGPAVRSATVRLALLLFLGLTACSPGTETAPVDAVQWTNGLPLPRGATPRPELSGATSVNPGHNQVVAAFELALPLEDVRGFYAQNLPDEFARTESADEVVFSSATHRVRLERRGARTLVFLVTTGL